MLLTQPFPKVMRDLTDTDALDILLLTEEDSHYHWLAERMTRIPEVQLRAPVGSIEEVCSAAVQGPLDLIIVEPRVGEEAVRILSSRPSVPPILAMPVGGGDQGLGPRHALIAGACGYLSPRSSDEQLGRALRTVVSGQIFVDKTAEERLAASPRSGTALLDHHPCRPSRPPAA